MKEQLSTSTDYKGETDGVCVGSNKILTILDDVSMSVLDKGIGFILDNISETAGDMLSGTLLSALQDPLEKSLENISQQITDTQEMISTLQTSVNDLQSTVDASFKIINQKLSRSEFNRSMSLINSTFNTVNSLQTHYNEIINMCYDDNNIKKELSDYDKANLDDKIKVFIKAIESANIEDMINDLNSQTNPSYGDSTYYIANDYFINYYPFEHQTYRDMYNVFNLISNIRTIALHLYKEYQSYNWKTSGSILTQEDYLNNHYINIYNSAVASINKEVESEPALNELSTKLLNVQIEDKIKYLEDSINIDFTYAYNNNLGDVYKVKAYKVKVNSSNKKNCFVILKESLKLKPSSWETYYKHHKDTVTQHHNGVADPVSIDTTYISADSQSLLKELLANNSGCNQTDFLVKNIPGLDPSTNGFALKEDEEEKETSKNNSNYLGVYTTCYKYLNLLDGRKFDPAVSNINDYILKHKKGEGAKGMNGKDEQRIDTWDIIINQPNVDFTTSTGATVTSNLPDAKFFVIFKDTNI
ncbi:MAG: methyl-accepting chemotaxis protein [Lutisporaceae bacterium]